MITPLFANVPSLQTPGNLVFGNSLRFLHPGGTVGRKRTTATPSILHVEQFPERAFFSSNLARGLNTGLIDPNTWYFSVNWPGESLPRSLDFPSKYLVFAAGRITDDLMPEGIKLLFAGTIIPSG